MDPTSIILLVVGFGLVIFVHELGHFLAAKYVGICVEQFALGFGHALLCWRKGIGLTVGTSEKKLEELKKDALNFDPKKYGETEYRLNWIPLGGYVKMMGQDDSKPGLQVNDPRSYTSKSVGARMLVISAGVIMNAIFAAVGFMILFRVGLKVPSPVVGSVMALSPAQQATTLDGKPAPLRVGDRILRINGIVQHDFTKIKLATVLAKRGSPLAVDVRRRDGITQTLQITPQIMAGAPSGFLMLGISPSPLLEAVTLVGKAERREFDKLPPSLRVLLPGDIITQIDGQDVGVDDYWKLDDTLQKSDGRPIALTVKKLDGTTRQVMIQPRLVAPFGQDAIEFAGMRPRVEVMLLMDKTAVEGKLQRGDVVLAVRAGGDVKNDPSLNDLLDRVEKAATTGTPIDLTVLRDGKDVTVTGIVAKSKLYNGTGIAFGPDEAHAVVAGTAKDSPAGNVPAGSTIVAVNDVAVTSWYDVLREMRKAQAGTPLNLSLQAPSGGPRQATQIKLADADLKMLRAMAYSQDLLLATKTESRTTDNPLRAAWWGVTETRDFVIQSYVTVQRMIEGTVSVKNMMGPVGIFTAGTGFAQRGLDYLLWFMAMISVNLAVVNFLPIPVVDGGHFMFLLIEKLRGKPVSEKTQILAQYVGLSLIGIVFVLVTYQDIVRMISSN